MENQLKSPTPRITIIVENFAGIKKQSWSGCPKSLKASWPVKLYGKIGSIMEKDVFCPDTINLEIEMVGEGATVSTVDYSSGWKS